MSSFPVPVSPVMSTVESVGATLATWSSTARRAGAFPIGSPGSSPVSRMGRVPSAPAGTPRRSRPSNRQSSPAAPFTISTDSNVMVVSSAASRPLEHALHDVQQGISTDGLAKEGHGPRLQGPALLLVARPAGQEDDGDAPAIGGQAALELKAVDPGHAHVEDQASGALDVTRRQKLLRGSEALGGESERADEPACGESHRDVVVHDGDESLVSSWRLPPHRASRLSAWRERSGRWDASTS